MRGSAIGFIRKSKWDFFSLLQEDLEVLVGRRRPTDVGGAAGGNKVLGRTLSDVHISSRPVLRSSSHNLKRLLTGYTWT